MKASIGRSAQIKTHLPVLKEIAAYAEDIHSKIRNGTLENNPVEALVGLCNLYEPFCLTEEHGEILFGFDDQMIYPDVIAYDNPEKSVLEICNELLLLGETDEENIDYLQSSQSNWLSIIANRCEKEIRTQNHLIETDGFTAWSLALEGSRYEEIDFDSVKTEIKRAMIERDIPTDDAARFISMGYKYVKRAENEGKSHQAHWNYKIEQREKSIAKQTFYTDYEYEGKRIKSDIRFGKKLILNKGTLEIETDPIPEAALIGIRGRYIEEIVAESRLHEWGIKCSNSSQGLVRDYNREYHLLNVVTNINEPECRLCFQDKLQ